MSGHERTVRVALLSYQDDKGRNRIAHRGEKVTLSDEDLERAERLNAVVEGDLEEDGPAATVPQPQPPVDPEVAGLTEDGEVPDDGTEKPRHARRSGEREPAKSKDSGGSVVGNG